MKKTYVWCEYFSFHYKLLVNDMFLPYLYYYRKDEK